MIASFSYKLAGMRKDQRFVVYPRKSASDPIKVQSDKSIGMFDPVTGRGLLNRKGKYFLHLNEGLGAEPFEFPREFIDMALAAELKQQGGEGFTGTVKLFG